MEMCDGLLGLAGTGEGRGACLWDVNSHAEC